MTDTDILISGVLVFVMALIGLVLTVVEFRRMPRGDRTPRVQPAAVRESARYVRET